MYSYERQALSPDIHVDPLSAFQNAVEVPLDGEKVCFIKTHTFLFPSYLLPISAATRIRHYGFIYIYRHPLDVFLSALNYLYVRGMGNYFLDKERKSVDEMKSDGSLRDYIQLFIRNMTIGRNAFLGMCGGNWLEHVRQWLGEASDSRLRFSAVIRYEDLRENPYTTLAPLAKYLSKEDSLETAIQDAEARTARDGRLFWKQRRENFREYLEPEEIERFMNKYGSFLTELGYPSL